MVPSGTSILSISKLILIKKRVAVPPSGGKGVGKPLLFSPTNEYRIPNTEYLFYDVLDFRSTVTSQFLIPKTQFLAFHRPYLTAWLSVGFSALLIDSPYWDIDFEHI
jgi:hypothetical protein